MSDEIKLIDLRECFFRVSNNIFDMNLDIYEIGIYSALCRFANNDDKKAFPSITKLQNMLKISRPKAIQTLKSLHEKQIIYKEQGKYNVSSKYYLLSLPKKSDDLVNNINQSGKPHLLGSKPRLPEVVNDVYPIKTTLNKTNKENLYNKAFIKPSLNEIQSYIQEKRWQVNAEKFIAHYESNGWRVGHNPMKNWKAALKTWQYSDFNKDYKPPQKKQLTGAEIIEIEKKKLQRSKHE